jgi:hypothetical protein
MQTPVSHMLGGMGVDDGPALGSSRTIPHQLTLVDAKGMVIVLIVFVLRCYTCCATCAAGHAWVQPPALCST